MNQKIKRMERDGSVKRQFYDPDGQLVKGVRLNEYAGAEEDGKGVQYTYDAQGRFLRSSGRTAPYRRAIRMM